MSAIKREHWKNAVVVEFEKLYEVNLLSIGDETGAGQMDIRLDRILDSDRDRIHAN